MKTFKVTLTVELALDDDYEVTTDPTDHWLSLRKGQEYFMPSVEWLERRRSPRSITPGRVEATSDVSWQTVDDETGNMFINATQAEGYHIEQIVSTWD